MSLNSSFLMTCLCMACLLLIYGVQPISAQETTTPLSLVVEADSYNLPFSPLKAPVSTENITVYALLGSNMSARPDLTYTWRYNSSVIASQSGPGQNAFSLLPPQSEANLQVTVENQSEEVLATGSVTISPKDPQVLIYAEHPLAGIYFNNLLENDVIIRDEEVTFHAFPYGLGVDSQYQWRLNSQAIEGASGNVVTLRRQAEVEEAELSVTVAQPNSLTGRSTRGLNLIFE